MLAVRYHGGGSTIQCETVAVPLAGPNEVLIDVKAAALCHTELHFEDGTLDLGVKPMTLGHEAVGVIVSVGEGVPASRIGERVIVYYYVGCGECRWCKSGDEQLCGSLKAEFGFISDGGLAGSITVPSRNAVLLPASISFERAAPIGCGVTTAVHASKRVPGGLQRGHVVVIYGCNGVGHGLVQLAKHRGCTVIAIARRQAARDKAVNLGADFAIDGTDATTVAAAVRAAAPDGADVIFECVGRRETMDACVGWAGALGKRGTLVLVGYTKGDKEHDFRCHPIPMVVYEQAVVGSVGATLSDLKEAIQLVEDGHVDTVVDSTINLTDFQSKGLDKLRSCTCLGKIVVNNFLPK